MSALPATCVEAKHQPVPAFVDVLRIAVVTVEYSQMKMCVHGAVHYRNVTVVTDTLPESCSIARLINAEHVTTEETKNMFDLH